MLVLARKNFPKTKTYAYFEPAIFLLPQKYKTIFSPSNVRIIRVPTTASWAVEIAAAAPAHGEKSTGSLPQAPRTSK
jgi:hypothetical protein